MQHKITALKLQTLGKPNQFQIKWEETEEASRETEKIHPSALSSRKT